MTCEVVTDCNTELGEECSEGGSFSNLQPPKTRTSTCGTVDWAFHRWLSLGSIKKKVWVLQI